MDLPLCCVSVRRVENKNQHTTTTLIIFDKYTLATGIIHLIITDIVNSGYFQGVISFLCYTAFSGGNFSVNDEFTKIVLKQFVAVCLFEIVCMVIHFEKLYHCKISPTQ